MTGPEDQGAVDLPAVQGLLASWWWAYDAGDVAAWPDLFTEDASFSCRSDSGRTAFEEFVRADVRGRRDVLDWHEQHRRASPYPLRHNAANVHLAGKVDGGTAFRSYIYVTHVVGGAVANLASGTCTGSVRAVEGACRFAQLHLVLDFTDSVPFDAAEVRPS
jgi:hypothetical protein